MTVFMHDSHPTASADAMLAQHAGRLDLIRQYANEADATDFERKWQSVLRGCAQWFSTMPLRPDEHAESGGAFRASVETAYYAMRLSGGQKFAANESSERRRLLEPQYLYALFLAACCTWLDEPCRHFHFHREPDGEAWNPAAHGAFNVWLGDATYRVIRREASAPVQRMRTALLAHAILGSDRLGWLDPIVQNDLFGAIQPEGRPIGNESLLHRLVRQAVEVTGDFERKARRAAFALDTTPAPPASQVEATATSEVARREAPAPAPAATAKPPTSELPAGPNAAAGLTAMFAATEPRQDTGNGATAQAPAPAPSPKANVTPSVPLDTLRSPRREAPDRAADPFAEVLSGASNLMRDFFRALTQDVAAGKVQVAWGDRGLTLSKRSLASYGITSETLIEHLRKLNLLASVQGSEIVLVERVGVLVSPR
ncbi:TraI domain-containing protein [Cupriavidus sp. USMAHM13]|uniref:TraI domain-containing protein n=1 Tax=Cupriavidus sp. USMAHM13 TaxID=1389192 RepID=UPI000AE3D7B9|nr:TraI domain-containing protein [Cupriavidus sp. USMAHM13]